MSGTGALCADTFSQLPPAVLRLLLQFLTYDEVVALSCSSRAAYRSLLAGENRPLGRSTIESDYCLFLGWHEALKIRWQAAPRMMKKEYLRWFYISPNDDDLVYWLAGKVPLPPFPLFRQIVDALTAGKKVTDEPLVQLYIQHPIKLPIYLRKKKGMLSEPIGPSEITSDELIRLTGIGLFSLSHNYLRVSMTDGSCFIANGRTHRAPYLGQTIRCEHVNESGRRYKYRSSKLDVYIPSRGWTCCPYACKELQLRWDFNHPWYNGSHVWLALACKTIRKKYTCGWGWQGCDCIDGLPHHNSKGLRHHPVQYITFSLGNAGPTYTYSIGPDESDVIRFTITYS